MHAVLSDYGGFLERLLSHLLQWQADGRIRMRMSVLTEGQPLRPTEETVTEAYRVLYCQGLSVQCYQQLIMELEGHIRKGKLFLFPIPRTSLAVLRTRCCPPRQMLPVLLDELR